MKSRTTADRGDPMGCGSAATTRSTSIARAAENRSPGAEAASGPRRVPRRDGDHDREDDEGHDQPGEEVATSTHSVTVAGGGLFATRLRGEDWPHEEPRDPWRPEGAGRVRHGRRRPRALRARRRRAGRSSTCTAPRAPSTTSRSRWADASRSATRPSRWTGRAPASAAGRRPATTHPRRRPRCCAPPRPPAAWTVRLLVGHSFGAAVALAWALDAPESVAAVVDPRWLRAPARRTAALGRRAPAQPRRASRRGRGRPLPRGPSARRERREAGVLPWYAAPPTTSAIAPRLALETANLIGDGEDRKAAEEGLAALRPLYPGLLVPLVIVVGEQDRMVPPAPVRASARAGAGFGTRARARRRAHAAVHRAGRRGGRRGPRGGARRGGVDVCFPRCSRVA